VIPPDTTKSSSSLSGGQVAGIVIGCIFGSLIILLALICCFCVDTLPQALQFGETRRGKGLSESEFNSYTSSSDK